MAETSTQFDLHAQLLERFRTTVNGKRDALVRKRLAAAERFRELGFPTTKHEEWKYTSVRQLITEDYSLTTAGSISADQIDALRLPDAKAVVVVNGRYRADLSDAVEQKGVTVTDFEGMTELLEDRLNNISQLLDDAFVALNSAYAANGLLITVDKGVIAEHTLQVIYVNDTTADRTLAMPRTVVVAGENAQLKLLETYTALGDNRTLTNAVSEFYVDKSAVVSHYKVHDHKPGYAYIGHTFAQQETRSVFNTMTFNLSGDFVRNNLYIKLNDEYIESNLNGLYLTRGNQHVDNHTVADHAYPNCNSNELYKGLADDKSTAVFNGKIFVREDAQQTNAFQSNRNLLLSDQATINTKPQLEIFADDVKCSHGATVGQLDEAPLFYMQARGIPRDKAKRLLMRAFAFEVVEMISDETIKTFIGSKTDAVLSF